MWMYENNEWVEHTPTEYLDKDSWVTHHDGTLLPPHYDQQWSKVYHHDGGLTATIYRIEPYSEQAHKEDPYYLMKRRYDFFIHATVLENDLSVAIRDTPTLMRFLSRETIPLLTFLQTY